MQALMRWVMAALVLFAACPAARALVAEATTAKDLGLTLIPLAPEDLDSIGRATGHRVGVMVTKVDEGSPAAKAGIKKGDMILAFGNKGVDSPKAADDALAGKTGSLDVGILRISEDGEAQPVKLTIALPERTPPAEADQPAAPPDTKPATDSADIQAKLKALEDAHKAGVLSDAEYAKKKADLEAKLRQARKPVDPEVQKKLKALDDARKAGVLSDEEYAKKRAALLGTTASAPAGVGAPKTVASRQPLIPATKSKVFHHPIGFEFVHPVDWTVREQGDMLVLTPPNQASGAQGALEAYLITGERVDTEGITRPDDPRVAEFLDQQVKQILPSLTRTGQPGSIDTSSGKAIVLDWMGKSPQGEAVLARCYVNIIKGHGVALAGIGMKSRVEARDPVLRRMFVSFGMQEGKQDPALVGNWALSGTTSITNWSTYEDSWSRAKMASESNTRLSLAADGTWSRVYESQTLAGAGGIWLESSNRKVSKGKWYAGGGMLYLVTDDDLWETYKYNVGGDEGGRQLRLASEKTGTLWKQAQ